MKRRHLVHYLISQGCKEYREGGKHTLFWNPTNKKISAVPRHTEIGTALARKICRDLEIPDP